MRKNVKQQLALRALSTAALMAMVSSIATAAFADTYDLNKGSVDILAEGGKQYITQWEDKDNDTCVKDGEGKEIRDREDSDIILTTKNKDTGETETTSNTVTITAEDGNTANVTLKNVDIEQPDSNWGSVPAPIEIKGNGNTNLELDGNNTVLSGNGKHAGIEKADVNGTGTLTIKDDKNDDGTPKDKDENGNAVGKDTGKLLAGGYGDGAGIGGGSSSNDLADTSNITIKGGEITARGGYEDGAGIGGGTYGKAKNIRIEGNAHVTASGDGGAGIGGGLQGNDVTITGNAVVNAYSEYGSAIGDGRPWGGGDTTITISGNATVHAEGKNGTTAIGSSQNGHQGNLTITIAENANVTAIGSVIAPAIGNAYSSGDGNTTIRITGGTVNVINSYDDNKNLRKDYPAIGAKDGKLNLTIDGSTGDTVVNVYQNDDSVPDGIGEPTTDPETGKTVYKIPTSADYNEDGSSNLGEKNSVVINYYKNASVTKEPLQLPDTLDKYAEIYPGWNHHCTITGGTLTKVVHNRKYMEEHPEIVDINKLKDEDLHDWQPDPDGKYKEPTLEEDGYVDCICGIDKCGQTKRVPLPKIVPDTPSTPDTPDTPDTPSTPDKPDTPKQPDGTTPAPVTPDAPAQDGTAPVDTPAADTTADAAATPAAAQNVVQNAEPEAAAPAAVSAAALPQTGANWLAVVGSALSGLFLLAAGFVLDRKGRRMN